MATKGAQGKGKGKAAAKARDVWGEYTTWLAEHAPEAFANLAPPASESALDDLEKQLGQALPKPVRELLARNDGERKVDGPSALPGLRFLSCQRVVKEWKMWASLRASEAAHLDEHDAAAANLDPGVRPVYTHPAWIPLFQDGDRSDYFGLDLAPARGGKKGQLINFGRDEDQHFIAAPDLDAFLAFWLAEVRAGRCAAHDQEPRDSFVHQQGNSIDVLRKPAQVRAKKLETPKSSVPWKPPADERPAASSCALLPVPDPNRDLGPRFASLDEVHAVFLAGLIADPAPRADAAIYWYEGLNLWQKKAGQLPWTRGDDALYYRSRNQHLGAVQGLAFPPGKLAGPTCKAVLLENAKAAASPSTITFQYERGPDGVWRGNYAVETHEQNLALLQGREPYVKKLCAELKRLLSDGIERAAVIYGNNPRQKDGPELRVFRTGDQYTTFHDLSGALLDRWNDLVRFLQGQGVSRLLNVSIELDLPRPTARPKQRVMILSCR
jgi:cell wall assembly regulator SMI1